jgi:FixJ family two-component response regulator
MSSSDTTTVFIVDDDARMRAAMQRLLTTVGLHSESFATPQDFLRRKLPGGVVVAVQESGPGFAPRWL